MLLLGRLVVAVAVVESARRGPGNRTYQLIS
jgi:hypothetical protein